MLRSGYSVVRPAPVLFCAKGFLFQSCFLSRVLPHFPHTKHSPSFWDEPVWKPTFSSSITVTTQLLTSNLCMPCTSPQRFLTREIPRVLHVRKAALVCPGLSWHKFCYVEKKAKGSGYFKLWDFLTTFLTFKIEISSECFCCQRQFRRFAKIGNKHFTVVGLC